MDAGGKPNWTLPTVLDSVTDYGIVLLNRSGRVVFWNAGAERLFQFHPAEIMGRSIEAIYTVPDCLMGEAQQEMRTAAVDGRAADNRWHMRRDGSLVWIDGTLASIRNGAGRVDGYVKIMHDATERRRSEEAILKLARIDALTGLGNRLAFSEHLQPMAEMARRRGQSLVVLMVDLDRFKQVNDDYGHAAGDQVLLEVARRMTAVVRRTDFVARLGGDEFVVVQGDVGDPKASGQVAQHLVDVLAEPFLVDDSEVYIGASIGMSVYPQDSTDLERLLRMADSALYGVKGSVRGGYAFYSHELDTIAHRRSQVRARLKQAVRNRAFTLNYQPQLEGEGDRVIAVEALLRCTDPELAHCTITELLELAHSVGLMREIGLWALDEACRQARHWRQLGLAPVRLCVNFCAVELSDPQMLEHIQEILDRHRIEPSEFEVEVTERYLLAGDADGNTLLHALRERGVHVAIDDFGTGYSSLGHLLQLPVDRIKLDRVFVQRVPDDPEGCAIATAIVGLAHTLKLEIVVEGVESAEQAAFFRAARCEGLQGYYFSRPLAQAEMTRWLQERVVGTARVAH